eukprot:1597376-Prymnesium_polylepis.1
MCWHCCRGPAPTGTFRRRLSPSCTTCHHLQPTIVAADAKRTRQTPPTPVAARPARCQTAPGARAPAARHPPKVRHRSPRSPYQPRHLRARDSLRLRHPTRTLCAGSGYHRLTGDTARSLALPTAAARAQVQ